MHLKIKNFKSNTYEHNYNDYFYNMLLSSLLFGPRTLNNKTWAGHLIFFATPIIPVAHRPDCAPCVYICFSTQQKLDRFAEQDL